MESFEQSYATLPQDLVGNLRPAAREIGFIRSLSPSFSPSVFQSSSQRDCPKLRLSSPPDERPHPAFPHALSFVTAWRIVSRVSRFSTPLCFIVLLPSPRYSKESIPRGEAAQRGQSTGRKFRDPPGSSPGIGISSFPTLPSVSSPLSSHPLGCMGRKAVLVAPCVIGKREYRVRYLSRLGTEEKGQLRPTGRNQVSSSSLLIRNPSINQRY